MRLTWAALRSYSVLEAAFSRMKLGGFLLLLAGWWIVLTAVALLKPTVPQTIFIIAGIGVELLGLGFLIRSHMAPRREKG